MLELVFLPLTERRMDLSSEVSSKTAQPHAGRPIVVLNPGRKKLLLTTGFVAAHDTRGRLVVARFVGLRDLAGAALVSAEAATPSATGPATGAATLSTCETGAVGWKSNFSHGSTFVFSRRCLRCTRITRRHRRKKTRWKGRGPTDRNSAKRLLNPYVGGTPKTGEVKAERTNARGSNGYNSELLASIHRPAEQQISPLATPWLQVGSASVCARGGALAASVIGVRECLVIVMIGCSHRKERPSLVTYHART